MADSDYQSKNEARYQLKVSYNDTFSVLTDHNNQNRFTDKEKASFDYIINNHRIETDNPFSVDNWKMGSPTSPQPMAFDFHGTPQEVLKTSKDVIDFVSAHEIKHASLAYNNYVNGAINIKTFVSGSAKIHRGIADLQQNIPAIAFFTKPLAYGVKIVHAAFQRQEERLCDRFALRVYPKADISKQKAFVEERDNKLLSDIAPSDVKNQNLSVDNAKRLNTFEFAMLNLKGIVGKLENTHPDNDSRFSSLVKIQNQKMV